MEWGIIVVVGVAHKRWDVHEGLAMSFVSMLRRFNVMAE
jgi:hypothetical protein